jgi:hypothetical protein
MQSLIDLVLGFTGESTNQLAHLRKNCIRAENAF